jgi:ribosomal protein S18 acetylase RimI-like enzyme
VEIRELVAGGADQLVALFAAVLPGSPTAPVDRLHAPEAFLRDSHSFALGAYVDGAPVGLAWGVQMRSPSGRLTTYLHELEVHEDWRRRGVGSALVTEAMNLARVRARRSSGCRRADTTRRRKRCTRRSEVSASRSVT